MSNFKITQLAIKDAFIATGVRYEDKRGFFEELYNDTKFEKSITNFWRQISIAKSKTDVLRGIHCSNYAKFVTCVYGEVYDIIVDLRPDSPTFMKWIGIWLNENEPVHLYVPKRCGHGYYCRSESLFLYFQDGVYNQTEDFEMYPFDTTINIRWPKPLDQYIISDKDLKNKHFNELKGIIETNNNISLAQLELKQNQEDNDNAKFLIYGNNGFLGKYMIDELKRANKKFVIGKMRLENRTELLTEIKLHNPTNILCFAGIAGKPNIAWCEDHQPETIRSNIVGQLNIADISNELKIHCTLLVTGVIYQYDNEHKIGSGIGFTEEDAPNFKGNFYSKLRILEEELLKSYPNVLALRISYPTTADLHPNSLVSKLIKFSKIESIPLSITVVDDLWPVILQMSEKNITGTFNFNNPGTITHDEILTAYKTLVDANHKWENVEPNIKNRAACELSAKKLLDHGFNVPHIKDSMNKIMLKIREEKATT